MNLALSYEVLANLWENNLLTTILGEGLFINASLLNILRFKDICLL